MAEPVTQKAPVEYINNPFFIGTKGINLVFLKAQGVAILLVILSVLSVLTSYKQPEEPAMDGTFSVTPEIAALIVALALLIITGATFVNGIMAYTAAKTANGGTATIKVALRATAKRFWSFLWLQILTALKVLAWSLLFIIPGIIKSVQYSLAPVAFFDKELRGNAAIKHSVALTKGSWITTVAGQTLFTIITLGIIDLLVATASSAILYRQYSQTPSDQRPKPHGLSVATLILLILAVIIGILAALFLAFAGLNYMNGPIETGTV